MGRVLLKQKLNAAGFAVAACSTGAARRSTNGFCADERQGRVDEWR